jgi:hypothetical protein
VNLDELDKRIAQQQERFAAKPITADPCVHQWGTAYKSSSGRKVCVKCGFVTEKPFDTLGVGER